MQAQAQGPGVQRSSQPTVGQSHSPMPKVAGETRKAGHVHTRAYRGVWEAIDEKTPD
jgi:hypothetical protein